MFRIVDRPRVLAVALLLGGGVALAACQKIAEPVPTLTQDQWRRVQENLLTEAPADLTHRIDATYGDLVKLVGWSIDPAAPEIGGEATVTFYWEVLRETEERWQFYVHLDAGATRQNADHEAIGSIYPSRYWRAGQIIRDEVPLELLPGLGDGPVRVYAGLFKGDDRLEVSAPGQAVVEEDGRLFLGTFESQWNAPTYAVRRATGVITVDGELNEPAWSRARQTDLFVGPSDGAEAPTEAWAKLMWDDTNLYVAMRAEDADIWSTFTNRDADLWDEEVLEVYIDPGQDGLDYVELQVNPLNTVFDAVFAQADNRDLPAARAVDLAGLQTAVRVNGSLDVRSDEDTEWTVEIAIPFAALPGLETTPTNNQTIGINFYRYDRGAGPDAVTSAWSPVGPGSFHNPARFGVATFQGAVRRRPISTDGSGAAPIEAGFGSGAAAPTGALQRPLPGRALRQIGVQEGSGR